MQAQSSSVSANHIADIHGVPRSTLKDRLRGRVVHGTNPGPHPYLDAAEESELVDHLFQSAKAGYGKTRQQVKGIAEKVAKSKGVLSRITSLMGGGEDFWPDSQSWLFVVAIRLHKCAWMLSTMKTFSTIIHS